MKEFKRWWIRKYNHRKGNDNSHLGYPEAHQAWQAALEMVLEECTLSALGYGFIKKELEE